MNLRVMWFAAVITVVWAFWILVDLVAGEPYWWVWPMRAVLTLVMSAGCVAFRERAPDQAVLPENVRLELADGSTEVVNLAYMGCRHGDHWWGILREVPADACAIRVDNRPPHTVIFAIRS